MCKQPVSHENSMSLSCDQKCNNCNNDELDGFFVRKVVDNIQYKNCDRRKEKHRWDVIPMFVDEFQRYKCTFN